MMVTAQQFYQTSNFLFIVLFIQFYTFIRAGDGHWSLPGVCNHAMDETLAAISSDDGSRIRTSKARLVWDDVPADPFEESNEANSLIIEFGGERQGFGRKFVDHATNEKVQLTLSSDSFDVINEDLANSAFSTRTASAITKNVAFLHSQTSLQSKRSDNHGMINEQLRIQLKKNFVGSNDGRDGVNNKRSKLKFRSTGTTIAGIVVENGKYVVLGADTRATDDRIVADKACEKIHCLSSNIWCCGAGTSADLDMLTRQIKYTLSLKSLTMTVGNSPTPSVLPLSFSSNDSDGIFVARNACVSTACRLIRDALYEGNGNVGANIVLGGYDEKNKQAVLTAIHPHGSMDVDIPFSALGSGGLAAMGVLERNAVARRGESLSLDDGIHLIIESIKAGIYNDLGSGSNIDICVIGPNGYLNYTRNVVTEEELFETFETMHNGSYGKKNSGIKANGIAERSYINEEDSDDYLTEFEGVNGFGNLKYAIQSQCTLSTSYDDQEKKKDEKWEKILGL